MARDTKEISWNEILRRTDIGNVAPPRRVEKSKEYWKENLDKDTFYVTRNSGTEPPFSSKMCSAFEPGRYACACCDEVLFDSTTKFDSKTGWPSFTQPIKDDVINYIPDYSFGTRIEAQCSVCDAHLGHVFPDGPKDSNGLRYCINALSLKKSS